MVRNYNLGEQLQFFRIRTPDPMQLSQLSSNDSFILPSCIGNIALGRGLSGNMDKKWPGKEKGLECVHNVLLQI